MELKKTEKFDSGKLTAYKSLQVMKAFLNSHYLRWLESLRANEIDDDSVFSDIKNLLNKLEENELGDIIDQKVWSQWLEAINTVVPGFHEKYDLTVAQVFYSTKLFLENYCKRAVADDIAILLYQMNIINEWMDSVSFVLNDSFLNRR